MMKKTKTAAAVSGTAKSNESIQYRCCFAADTLVMTPDYPRAIQTLVEGDRIVTYDVERGGLMEDVVEKVEVFAGRFDVVEDCLGRNCVVRGAGGHYVYDGCAWVASEDMRVAMTATGGRLSAYSHVTNRKVHAVYRIQTASGTCLVGDEAILIGGPSMKISKTSTAHAAHVTSIHV
jgi:hypothetical protein